MSLETLAVIVVGVVVLGIIWRVVKGAIRLVFTIGILLLIGYLVLNAVR